MEETFVYYSGTVKALGDYKVGGELVILDEPGSGARDVTGDFFTKSTDFGSHTTSPVFFDHGLDPVVKKSIIGQGTLTKTEKAIWIEAQLDKANQYAEMVYDLAQKGALGWSSGTAAHLFEKKKTGEIVTWHLGLDASLTPTPAEPRTSAVTLKSLITERELIEDEVPQDTGETVETSDVAENKKSTVEVLQSNEEQSMNEDMTKIADSVKSIGDAVSKNSTLLNKVFEVLDNDPILAKSGIVSGTGGKSDQNIKSGLDMLTAVKRGDSERLQTVYKAQKESVGSQGGFLVPEEVITELMPNITLSGPLGSYVRRLTVSRPAGYLPIRDYSRTPTAGFSSAAQGIESQSRAEGGAYVEETAYFERLQYQVTDACSGYVKASWELSEDMPTIEGLLRMAIEEDVVNREERFILQGTGVDQPLGVMNWSGSITIDEDTDNTFVYADMLEMQSRMLQSGTGRYAWVHSPGAWTQIGALEVGTGGAVYINNIPGAAPTALGGYPRFVSNHLPAIGSDGYIIYGDWSKYVIFERGGLDIRYSEDADFLNGNGVWRFSKRIDGKPIMTAAVTLPDASTTVSPFIIIGNKT